MSGRTDPRQSRAHDIPAVETAQAIMREVAFCDSRELRCLLTARCAARRLGRPFGIGPHSYAVARLLELSDTRVLLTTQP